MMPLPLIPVEAIIDTTIVDVSTFQKFSSRTLGFMGNCIFKILAIAKFWQCVLRANKLNGRTKRKTEYFSFLKHPCHQILRKITSIDDDDNPVSAAETAATTPTITTSLAAMTASEQQTGVITHINE